MKTSLIASLVLAALLVATGMLTAQETPPVVAVETFEGAFECEGDGLINVIADQCMHDGGESASGDSLEVYCYHGTARFCLSGEECPWRGEPAGVIDETCSRAGLDDEWMATAQCDGWNGYHDFACSESGQIRLQKEAREATPSTCGAPD
ncbi:MAG: hypothetical protein OEV00_06370 [Acidobacteriota bacterium]|nr:hypothetical protein [Acidobacteriota bacterium]MDH3784935.1 hypothetical protein [Acidobacteriota bacterium]